MSWLFLVLPIVLDDRIEAYNVPQNLVISELNIGKITIGTFLKERAEPE